MSFFSSTLLNWYETHQRDLPWRNTTDPYKVWLSEIMLQQTRVAQGLPYYQLFIKTFPSIFDLAAASEEEVLKLWQGLGYYSRARNLHHTAQYVAQQHKGVFPNSYTALKKLKGIGDYTASAMASICFQEPRAVLDGNVFRLLSRYFGIDTPINTTEGKKIFKAKAQQCLATKQPGNYNQAIMEFGALQCKPKNPDCNNCPLQNKCVAFQQGRVDRLPIKLKKGKLKKRYFNYLVFIDSHRKTCLNKRTDKDIWQNLYEFPLIECPGSITKEELVKHPALAGLTAPATIELFNSQPIKHQLTHQKLWVKYWIIHQPEIPENFKHRPYQLVDIEEIEKFPVPRLIDKFLNIFDF